MPSSLTQLLDIEYPVIAAPMFLISNTKMTIAALNSGISGAFPALNYRTDADLRAAIETIKAASKKSFGVNLIVNKSNPKYKKQLDTLVDVRVPYIITSLGNPLEVIERCKPLGIKVFCDVVDLKYALKVESLGADAVIAVNNRAGGHCGSMSPKNLITMLRENCGLPVISAGGIARGQDLADVLEWGAAGASVGTIFIACEEADVSPEYKQAMIDYGEKDIVLTTRLSGSHLTVINTPYVQKLGTKAGWFEGMLLRNKTLKKYAKMFVAFRGMKAVENAALTATYKTVWCAGPAIEHVKAIRPMKDIVGTLIAEWKSSTTKPLTKPNLTI
jgi:nitronate monooxygenase